MRSATPARPTSSVQVWYDVGGEGRSRRPLGLCAHVRTSHVQGDAQPPRPNRFDRLTEDVGGNEQCVHQRRLHRISRDDPRQPSPAACLFAEADRMASLVVEPKPASPPNASVVKEELPPERPTRSPYGKLFGAVFARRSAIHAPPLRARRRSAASTISTARQIDDVRAFHATYLPARQCGAGRLGQFRPSATQPVGRPVFRRSIKRPSHARSRVSPSTEPVRAPKPVTPHGL